MRVLKAMFLFLMVGVLFVIGLLFWASGPYQSPGIYSGKTDFLEGLSSPQTSNGQNTLKIMTWNIGYGHGIGSAAVNYQRKPKGYYEKALEGIARCIESRGADLVLIQEIDFGASRTYGVDQLRMLSEKTKLNYFAQALSWNARYVPFPISSFRNHFGRILSGGGVLSRFPLTQNTVRLLPKPAEQNFIYNLFYLYRYNQMVNVKIGERELTLVNNHLDAYSKANRLEQALWLAESVEKIVAEKKPVIVGGDFNTLPKGALKTKDFTDEVRDDYSNENTYDLFTRISGLKDVMPLDAYLKDEAKHFTFPTDGPNRKLDYVFYSQDFDLVRTEVVRECAESDHFAIFAEFRWK